MRGVWFAVLLGGLLLSNPLYAVTAAVTVAPSKTAGVSFKKKPEIDFANADLEGHARHIAIRININEQGKVSSVDILQSTGLAALDKKIIDAIMQAEFTPYMKDGKAAPVYSVLRFDMLLSD